MILHHAFAATELAERCALAMEFADIEVELDCDPGLDPLMSEEDGKIRGPGLALTSAPGEDLDLAVTIIQRVLATR